MQPVHAYTVPFMQRYMYSKVCPMPFLLASYANGLRAAIREFGPQLIGQNPLEIDKINHIMDKHLQGHTDAKTPIDIACWDILGKVGKFTCRSTCTYGTLHTCVHAVHV